MFNLQGDAKPPRSCLPLSPPLTSSRLACWWEKKHPNQAGATGVNGVRVSAGRLGDAEKSPAKVSALHCLITGHLADFKPRTHWTVSCPVIGRNSTEAAQF